MRTTFFILFTLVVLLSSGVSFAGAAEWQESVITNQTDENVYVVISTWKVENTKKGIPGGFRTRGAYRILPGKSRSFYSWSDNSIYFRISNSQSAVKPESGTSTFPFWVHPNRSFRLVSSVFEASVRVDQLLYADRSRNKLVHSDGFMRYSSGSEVSVTSEWVSLNGEPVFPVDDKTENGGAQNDNTENTENEDVLPAPQQEAVPAGMVLIPAGTFQMGSNSRWMPNNQHNIDWHASRDESPIHTVTLDAFYMDTHEVTNAEYTEFLNAKGENINTDHVWHWPGIDIVLDHRSGKYTVLKGYENHPVFSVSWYGAMAYAKWAGKRLPTEAEWEYAARGGLVGKKHPWGDTIDSTRANYDGNIGETTAVGSYAANGYGLYDMIGNVWEWCLDKYDEDFYAISPVRNPLSGAKGIDWLVDNYAQVGVRSLRVWRGASWNSNLSTARVSKRYNAVPTYGITLVGFRCVKSVSPAAANIGAPTPPKTSTPLKTVEDAVEPILSPKTPTPPKISDVPAGMVLIPAGTFQMGSNTGDADEIPIHAVSLDAFYMDTHEVTNAEYAVFLNAIGKHTDAGKTYLAIGSNGVRIDRVDGAYRAKAGYANRPVIRVSWYGAMAYARWAGKRLPTEAEWEYAARGGLAGKQYPWGDTIDATQANYGGNAGGVTAVGSYAANGYGLYDMVGNVFEWCLDGYNDGFYAISPGHNPLSGADSETIDAYMDVSSARVLRGGAALYPARVARVSHRDYGYPMDTGVRLGFRCAK